MKQKRFGSYGVIFHPRGGQNIDWSKLSKKEIVEELKKCGFLTPLEMCNFLRNVSIRGEKKKNGEGYYYATLFNFMGQLELGSLNGVPHYQLFLEVKPKLTKAKLLKYLSKKLYGKVSSCAISVKVLTEDTEAYEDYCKKEGRANLPGIYEDVIIDSTLSFFSKYLEENSQLKKFSELLILINIG